MALDKTQSALHVIIVISDLYIFFKKKLYFSLENMKIYFVNQSLYTLMKWLILWIIYVISVLFCYAFMHICLSMPCGHLLGKGWPFASRLWCLIVTLSLYHWYPGSVVVLDYIDSWSLPSFLLLYYAIPFSPIKAVTTIHNNWAQRL